MILTFITSSTSVSYELYHILSFTDISLSRYDKKHKIYKQIRKHVCLAAREDCFILLQSCNCSLTVFMTLRYVYKKFTI